MQHDILLHIAHYRSQRAVQPVGIPGGPAWLVALVNRVLNHHCYQWQMAQRLVIWLCLGNWWLVSCCVNCRSQMCDVV